ncbi:hypothetical protein Tco_0377025 [Tanacetum coccineum]
MKGQISLYQGITSSYSRGAMSTMVKAQETLTKEAQTSHQWNDTLAILRCPQLDQTATIDAWMVEEMIG